MSDRVYLPGLKFHVSRTMADFLVSLGLGHFLELPPEGSPPPFDAPPGGEGASPLLGGDGGGVQGAHVPAGDDRRPEAERPPAPSSGGEDA